jgi:predicted PurR-regulated permease PerM
MNDDMKAPATAKGPATVRDRKLSRYFFAALLLLTVGLFFYMVRLFAIPVLLAAVFASLFYPLFRQFLRLCRGRRGIAAFLSCCVLLLLLVVPVYIVADLVAREALSFYHSIEQDLKQAVTAGPESLPSRLLRHPLARRLRLDQIDWTATARDAAKTAGGYLGVLIRGTYRGAFQVLLLVFATLFTLFYFFRDGPRLVERLKYLIPLSEEYENAIITRFTAVARATVRGTLLIALLQGTAAGITLWIFGVGSAILWGVVAVVCAVIPLVGAWIVLFPAALIQMLNGNLWHGVGIILVTVLVINQLDNLVRPRLVGQESGMHDLMVFFSTLGGIATFGPMGFIVGPVIAALFLAILDIYSTEFRQELELYAADASVQAAVAQGGVSERPPVPAEKELEDARAAGS